MAARGASAAWMHRKGNVHDFAFTNGPGPRLHHLAYWVPTAINIMHLCDVMASSGYLANIERGPGRHGISNAFFLYVRDLDGHRIELYAWDYLTGDPDHEPVRWSVRDPRRQTLWARPRRAPGRAGIAVSGTGCPRTAVCCGCHGCGLGPRGFHENADTRSCRLDAGSCAGAVADRRPSCR